MYGAKEDSGTVSNFGMVTPKAKSMTKNLNKELYGSELFHVWSQKKGLLEEEAYMIHKYLVHKDARVLEAGTGGGRIIFEIEALGFTNLHAFDYVEKMIEYCDRVKAENSSPVDFAVADATDLNRYPSHSFDVLVYLQQVLCFIDEPLVDRALEEAYRLGAKDSVYLFSFLNWHSKFYNPILSGIVNLFRKIRGEKVAKHKLPWLMIDGRFNWKLLQGTQPGNYWYKKSQIRQMLAAASFKVIEMKTAGEILGGGKTDKGHVYVACSKR